MLFPLRKMNYETLLDDTRLLIARYKPQVVIIDADTERKQAEADRRNQRQQQQAEERQRIQESRLNILLTAIRDNGGSISRKQLTEILAKKFDVERTTVSKFITAQIEAKAFFEVDKMIHASDELALAF